MQLKFKKLDRFQQVCFSTHGVPDAARTQKKLTKLSKKLAEFNYNPVWVSEEHKTCLVTCKNKDLKLIENGLYEVDLEARAVGDFVNIWVNKCRLISKPEKGRVISMDSDDEDDSE